MKVRGGFVSNSSSSSFLIYNKSGEEKSIADFALENAFLIKSFNDSYGATYSIDEAILSAELDYGHISLLPGPNICTFGDEEGTILGRIYDYILRDENDNESKNFSWTFRESLR